MRIARCLRLPWLIPPHRGLALLTGWTGFGVIRPVVAAENSGRDLLPVTGRAAVRRPPFTLHAGHAGKAGHLVKEVVLPASRQPILVASFLACLAAVLELPLDRLPQLPAAADPATGWALSRWLGGLGLASPASPNRQRSPGPDPGWPGSARQQAGRLGSDPGLWRWSSDTDRPVRRASVDMLRSLAGSLSVIRLPSHDLQVAADDV